MCVQVGMALSVTGVRLLRLVAGAAVVGVTAMAGVGCASPSDDSGQEASGEDNVTGRGKLQLLVTVDWEGRALADKNLQAMRDLPAHFPDVKVVPFLNGGYFPKSDADPADVKTR